jgi:DNA-binding NarL/FixJ family response regulator
MGKQETVRVLIVDDHALTRTGLRVVLSMDQTLTLVGEATSGLEAVRLSHEHRPDVVVMDVRTPDMDGVHACREITQDLPKTQVVMLSTFEYEDVLIDSVMAGATGYVLKASEPETLLACIHSVARGKPAIDNRFASAVLVNLIRSSGGLINNPLGRLSEQERKLLPLVARGFTNREIAEALELSEETVKKYLRSVFKKLQVTSRAVAATVYAKHADRLRSR